MKRIMTWMLVCILVFGGTPAVFAATGERVPWKVEDIGTFYVPGEWEAAKLNLNKELLDGKKPGDVLKSAVEGNPQGLMPPAAKLNSLNIQAYQITLNDGTAYHLAWMMFFKDTKKMTGKEKECFVQEITEEQKVQIRGLMRSISGGPIPFSYEDPKTKVGFKLVEMIPVEFPKINKNQAFAGGGRGLITSDGLLFPLYGKGYVFNAKGYLAMAVLVTFDGERTFWEPVLNNVMTSLNRR